MRKHTEHLLAQAKVLRQWGNDNMADTLEARADLFERREPVCAKDVDLDSYTGGRIMAQRISVKLDDCEYGQAVEPGYDECVWRVFYNWNNAPKLGKAIERLSALGCPIEEEWEDEWGFCGECGRYVRTSPDSYGWTRSYYINSGDLICHECAKESPDEYIEWLTNHPKHANTILDHKELNELGWELFIRNLENGLHEGQAASPAKVAQYLRSNNVDEFLFSIEDVGQFDTTFSVWVKIGVTLLVERPDDDSVFDDSPSPSELAKAMLRQL